MSDCALRRRRLPPRRLALVPLHRSGVELAVVEGARIGSSIGSASWASANRASSSIRRATTRRSSTRSAGTSSRAISGCISRGSRLSSACSTRSASTGRLRPRRHRRAADSASRTSRRSRWGRRRGVRSRSRSSSKPRTQVLPHGRQSRGSSLRDRAELDAELARFRQLVFWGVNDPVLAERHPDTPSRCSRSTSPRRRRRASRACSGLSWSADGAICRGAGREEECSSARGRSASACASRVALREPHPRR